MFRVLMLVALLFISVRGSELSAQKYMKVEATAYCLRGTTATGTKVKHGTIAVDPRVIPLGSKIYVPGYGWGKAVDTGRLIKGRRIDVWISSRGNCYRWGRKQVTIKVYPPARKASKRSK